LSDGEAAKLGPLLREAAGRGLIGAERFDGIWTDVGTPARLAQLDAELRGRVADPVARHRFSS
jgi:MurNAc alpha-1-phosphate uridylyltransferase